MLLENYIIHRQLLEKINLELEKPGAAETYADAVKIFEDFGFDSSLHYPVLEHLKYRVIWAGLSEENAKIKKFQTGNLQIQVKRKERKAGADSLRSAQKKICVSLALSITLPQLNSHSNKL